MDPLDSRDNSMTVSLFFCQHTILSLSLSLSLALSLSLSLSLSLTHTHNSNVTPMKAAGKRLTVNLQAVLFRDVQQCFLFSTNTAEIAEDYPRQKSKAKRRSNLLTLLRKPNQKLARELTQSPQLSVKTLPLLSSCLPLSAFSPEDFAWMKDNLLSIKRCLLYAPSVMEAMDSTEPEDPLHHHESLLYLAFQHKGTCRHEQARHIRLGHSRLSFLGQYIVELALVEYFLMRYPRDVTACIRERIFGLTRRSMLPRWIESAGLHDVVFASNNNVKEFDGRTKLKIVRQLSPLIFIVFM
ncbi:hypothetical protein KP509_34G009200 [Ceratopteris richardii]|uniref:RNase III domain-containing protein n=1 Tax=Ceratopteris richardii TaxID=49495 RepID=A0A8T2QI88_CERRI|nr:hypothetical protein KP509_34G009200 [Ceratopteris richardii]